MAQGRGSASSADGVVHLVEQPERGLRVAAGLGVVPRIITDAGREQVQPGLIVLRLGVEDRRLQQAFGLAGRADPAGPDRSPLQ